MVRRRVMMEPEMATTTADGPAPTSSDRRHIPALDGLRGLAVAGVLLFHDGRLTGGFLGVDLFFALSGYLITSLLIDERARTGTLRLGAFWERRARRLLPALVLFLLAIVPMMRWWGSPAQLSAARGGAWPAFLYLSNWDQIRSSADYWALFTDPSPLTHLWSLAVEGQFYLVWPFVAFWCMRSPRWHRWLTGVAVGGFAASAAWMLVHYDPANPTRVYMGTDTRAFSILIGAVVALLGVTERAVAWAERRPTWFLSAQAALFVAVLASWASIDGASSAALYRGGLVLHSSACAVLAATIGPANLLSRVLSLAPLRWLGAISYGLYLWHWPVFIVLDEPRTGLDPLPLTVVRWAVSIAIAMASYHVLEVPVRHRWLLAAPRSALASTAVAAVALAGTTILVPKPDEQVATFDPSTIELPTGTTAVAPPATAGTVQPPSTPDITPPPSDAAPGTGTAATTATVATTAATTTWPPRRAIAAVAWEGDSVAYDSAPGVVAALTAAGLRTSAHTFLGVGLVAHDDIRPLDLLIPPLAGEPPDVVVYMLSGWDDAQPAAAQRASFDAYADAVADLGAVLLVLEPPPVDPARHTADHSIMMTAARDRAAARPGQVAVLDAGALWGPFAVDLNGDGTPERKPDGVHVCPSGAALLGHWLAHQLADRFDGVTPADPASWAGLDWVGDPRYDDPPGACASLGP